MDLILSETNDGVRLITFNRPEKKNAFKNDMWRALEEAFGAAREDPDVAVVVLTGAGGDFSAGVDLGSFGEPFEGPHPFQTAIQALYAFDKPLLAAARGVGIGFGATCLFHCDIVYVGESVRLRLPFVNLGLVPEAASSYTLQTVIGYQRAAELFFTAEWIDAAKALETGIALRAFPDDELLEQTLAKAREIACFPVGSLQATKRTLRAPHLEAIQAAEAAEQAGMVQQAGSPENIEAITAFMQKRKPDFRNLPPRS
jgi:enoyl-CoA hydratase/carnithine racemase